MQRPVAAAVALSMLFAPSLAWAAPTLAEKATAQALFEDGLQLMGAKNYAEACPKLEESERLDPALGTRFRLSECEEAVGRLASAWAGFLEVADLAHAAGQADREVVARQKAASLEPKLSKINVIVTQPDIAGLEVSHDHVIIGRGQWGTPVPIDPGTYTITATAPQKKPWRGNVTISADGKTGTLTVPALDQAPAAAAAVVLPLTSPPSSDSQTGSTVKILGFTLGGVGVVGMGTGVVLGFVAKSNYNGAGCGASTCTSASSESALNSARSLANVGTAVFIVGAAAAAGGVVMVLAAPRSHRGPSAAALHLGPGTAMLSGTF
jgi:hypothetical protein